jgi:lipopolysaccharide core heptose(I) kinase
VVVIARHQHLLEKLGLNTIEQVKAFQGDLIKNHRGRRDIFRIQATSERSEPLTLFLKRSWNPYKKDGLKSLLQRGRVTSISRIEWQNSEALHAAGIPTGALVACGEDCGLLREKFSFIITEAAIGAQTVQQFLRECPNRIERRHVFDALARFVRRMHDAGLSTPDLFTRHLFLDIHHEPLQFCLIDMARLDRSRTTSRRRRARDLAALNITAPLRDVSTKERVRFLRVYIGKRDKALFRAVRRRVKKLLPRGKFRDFALPATTK